MKFAALLPETERILGAYHPATLVVRNNHAAWTGEAGDAAQARDEFAALLPETERILGAYHPATLVVRNNHAAWTGEAGDAARARDEFAALLPEVERVLGADHPDALVTRNNLAQSVSRRSARSERTYEGHHARRDSGLVYEAPPDVPQPARGPEPGRGRDSGAGADMTGLPPVGAICWAGSRTPSGLGRSLVCWCR